MINKIFEIVSSMKITYSGGAVFLDLSVWLIVIIIVIFMLLGYDITATKKNRKKDNN